VALNPVHKGKRKTPGQVLDTYTYPELHDLARGNAWYTGQPEDNELLDQAVLKAKRKWVGDQLRELEDLGCSSGKIDPVGIPGSRSCAMTEAVVLRRPRRQPEQHLCHHSGRDHRQRRARRVDHRPDRVLLLRHGRRAPRPPLPTR
jgi:hypothetical protein